MEEHLLDDIERIHVEMESLFEEVMPSGRWPSMRRTRIWRPPTDVYETDTCVVVKVEIAGMREEDFDISLSSRVLTIAGVRRDPTAEVHGSTLSYQQMEIRYGDFRTEVYIPWAIIEDEIEATYEDGFLKVILPKAKAQKVHIRR